MAGFLSAISDAGAPALVYAEVLGDAPTVVRLLFDQALSPRMLSAALSGFSIPGKSLSSVTQRGSLVQITVSVAFAYGDSITVSYTRMAVDALMGLDGRRVASFSGYAVRNAVGSTTPVVPTLLEPTSTLVNLGGNVYTTTAGAASGSARGLCNLKIPANCTGWAQMDILSSNNWSAFMGLRSVYANDPQALVDYFGLTSGSTPGQFLRSLASGTNTGTGYTLTVGTDTAWRIRRDAAAKTVTLDTYTSSAWVQRYLFQNYYAGDLFIIAGIVTALRQLAGLSVVGGIEVTA